MTAKYIFTHPIAIVIYIIGVLTLIYGITQGWFSGKKTKGNNVPKEGDKCHVPNMLDAITDYNNGAQPPLNGIIKNGTCVPDNINPNLNPNWQNDFCRQYPQACDPVRMRTVQDSNEIKEWFTKKFNKNKSQGNLEEAYKIYLKEINNHSSTERRTCYCNDYSSCSGVVVFGNCYCSPWACSS